jgi:Fe-S cluster assembly iron-binding protein IscA
MDDMESMQEGPELVLTINAVERLRALLEESGDTHCKLRIEADGPADNPEYTFSFEEHGDSNDIELDYARIAVLLDPESHRRLRGREIDHRKNDNGEHFVVRIAV